MSNENTQTNLTEVDTEKSTASSAQTSNREEENTLESAFSGLTLDTTEDVVYTLIEDQDGGFADGLRELFQNGGDAPDSTEVHGYTTDEYTCVYDDGRGKDLTREDHIKKFIFFGDSTKRSDETNTVGTYGIGLGQAISKGQTTISSGGISLHIDIKNAGTDIDWSRDGDAADSVREQSESWARAIERAFADRPTDAGVTVVINHYDDRTPDSRYEWNNVTAKVEKYFRYYELAHDVELYLNDSRLSHNTVADKTDLSETVVQTEFTSKLDSGGTVHGAIGLKGRNTGIDVYSNGIYVTTVDSPGLTGTVVTSHNLDVNFARNAIKNDCPRWAEIEQMLNEEFLTLANEAEADKIPRDARERISSLLLNGQADPDEWEALPVFKTVSDDYISLSDCREAKIDSAIKNDVAQAVDTDVADVHVLNDTDPSTETLVENTETAAVETTDYEDEAERADAVNVTETKSHDSLQFTERVAIAAGNFLMARHQECACTETCYYFNYMELPDPRTENAVQIGESDEFTAWTDNNMKLNITPEVISDDDGNFLRWRQFSVNIDTTIRNHLVYLSNETVTKTADTDPSFRQRKSHWPLSRHDKIAEPLNDLFEYLREETLSSLVNEWYIIENTD